MNIIFLSCSIHLFNQCKKITNAKKLRRYKSNISLIVEQILTFVWSPNIAREVKNLSSSFKQIAWRSFELLNVLIRIVTSILSINCKQFYQKFCSNILCIVDITCHFFWRFGRNNVRKCLLTLVVKLQDLFWIRYDTDEG